MMGAKFRPVDRGKAPLRVLEARSVYMTDEQIASGLEVIRDAYCRNKRPNAPARVRTLEAAIERLRETQARMDAIERGTKCLLLQAAEHVGEAQQRGGTTRVIRRG